MYFTFSKACKHATGAFRGIEDGKVSWLCDDWLAIANQMALIKIVSCGQTVSFGTVKNAGVPTRTEVLFGARDERSTRPTQSDSRRSCAESARIVAAAPRASVLAERQGADLQISEQHRRARSSGDQATLCVDGWVQVVRERGHHDRWHRVGPSHSQGTILVWPRPSAPWLVEEGRMGDGTRVGTGSEKTKGLVATKISLDAPEPET